MKKNLEEGVEQYSSLWESEKEHYMLMGGHGPDRAELSFLIVDTRVNHATIIEDNDVAREVIKRMIAAGVQTGDPFDPKIRKELIRRRLAK